MTNQYEQQLLAERQMREQAQYDAVVNAIAGAQSDADAAQLRYQQAMQIGDMATASDAQRAISRAEARLVQLENGRDAWDEARVHHQQHQQRLHAQQQLTPEQIIDSMAQLSAREREWLRARPHLVTTQANVTRLQAAFYETQEKGLARDSDAYFDHFNDRFAGSSVNASGLTEAQKDAAKISGIDENTYAKMYEKMKQTDAQYGPRYQK
jgi:hypothetical protein